MYIQSKLSTKYELKKYKDEFNYKWYFSVTYITSWV